MRYFNGFQLMCLFAFAPFFIQYSHNSDFYAHDVLMWVLIVGYVIGFGSLTVVVGDNIAEK